MVVVVEELVGWFNSMASRGKQELYVALLIRRIVWLGNLIPGSRGERELW